MLETSSTLTSTLQQSCEGMLRFKFCFVLKKEKCFFFRSALLSGPLDATFIVYGDFDTYVPGFVNSFIKFISSFSFFQELFINTRAAASKDSIL